MIRFLSRRLAAACLLLQGRFNSWAGWTFSTHDLLLRDMPVGQRRGEQRSGEIPRRAQHLAPVAGVRLDFVLRPRPGVAHTRRKVINRHQDCTQNCHYSQWHFVSFRSMSSASATLPTIR